MNKVILDVLIILVAVILCSMCVFRAWMYGLDNVTVYLLCGLSVWSSCIPLIVSRYKLRK